MPLTALNEVGIPSSLDHVIQNCLFAAPHSSEEPLPLLVFLHGWSGDYKTLHPEWQEEAGRRKWLYIQPDFRGPNNNPDACGSRKAMQDVIVSANDFASEHLEIQCGNESGKIADKIENAGAIFIGNYSPVAVGDYWAGPSHTLPTGMTAKFFSALSANDFIKSTSIIEYNKEQLAESAADIIRLAEAEGLDAHAKSVKIRQQQ